MSDERNVFRFYDSRDGTEPPQILATITFPAGVPATAYIRASSISDAVEVSPFYAFINAHPAFVGHQDWIGDWDPEWGDITLDGSFSAAQLRAIADYMENNT